MGYRFINCGCINETYAVSILISNAQIQNCTFSCCPFVKLWQNVFELYDSSGIVARDATAPSHIFFNPSCSPG